MHFRLRGRQEHLNVKVEEFLSFQRDDGGVEFVTLNDGLKKTRCSEVRIKPRVVALKMFATGKKGYLVALLQKY